MQIRFPWFGPRLQGCLSPFSAKGINDPLLASRDCLAAFTTNNRLWNCDVRLGVSSLCHFAFICLLCDIDVWSQSQFIVHNDAAVSARSNYFGSLQILIELTVDKVGKPKEVLVSKSCLFARMGLCFLDCPSAFTILVLPSWYTQTGFRHVIISANCLSFHPPT